MTDPSSSSIGADQPFAIPRGFRAPIIRDDEWVMLDYRLWTPDRGASLESKCESPSHRTSRVEGLHVSRRRHVDPSHHSDPEALLAT
jgi:hypothetical protein